MNENSPEVALEHAALLRGKQGQENGLILRLVKARNGLMQQKRYSEAEAITREILAVEESIHAPLAEKAGSLNNIAHTLFFQGRLEEALELLKTSLEWAEQGGASLTDRGVIVGELGLVLRQAGRIEEAIAALESSLELKNLGGDSLTSQAITEDYLRRLTRESDPFND